MGAGEMVGRASARFVFLAQVLCHFNLSTCRFWISNFDWTDLLSHSENQLLVIFPYFLGSLNQPNQLTALLQNNMQWRCLWQSSRERKEQSPSLFFHIRKIEVLIPMQRFYFSLYVIVLFFPITIYPYTPSSTPITPHIHIVTTVHLQRF